LSVDGGATWTQAQLEGDDQPWTWRLWQAQLALPPGEHEIIVCAVDSAANTQPAHLRDVWNFKGYMNNAWHRVRVHVEK
jgi:sulfite oxidase